MKSWCKFRTRNLGEKFPIAYGISGKVYVFSLWGEDPHGDHGLGS